MILSKIFFIITLYANISGGKTVTLKALGLAAIMAKAGLYIPVD